MPRALFAIVFISLLGGTVFVLSTKTPEERTVVSDDGFVYLIGDFLQEEEVSIATVPNPPTAGFTAVIALVYQLYPPSKVLTTPAHVYFHYDPAVVDASALRIGFYDDAFAMWRTTDTDLSLEDHIVSTVIDQFGKWALLELDDVARPNFDAEMESLISAAPEKAVGYQIDIGYAYEPGDFVILEGAGKSGGCNGQYKTGTSTQLTSRGDIFSDHLQYQIVALWQMGDGCGAHQVVE